MGREKSKHVVTVIDVSKLQEHITEFMVKNGDVQVKEGGYVMSTPYEWGIVEDVKGNHYLINSEGCGNAIVLEDEADSIGWYKDHINSTGFKDGIGFYPVAQTSFKYKELVEEWSTPICKMTLDKFIREFGDRLNRNYGNWDKFLSGLVDKNCKRIKSDIENKILN
jgi:hypothetical protein